MVQFETSSDHKPRTVMWTGWEMGHLRSRVAGEMLGRQSYRCPLHVLANAGGNGKEDGLMRRPQQKTVRVVR